MRKISVHPLFVLICLIFLLAGKGTELGATVLAVALHEAGHYFVAKRRGFSLKNLSLMPYGAVMFAEDGLPDKDGFCIALAGPATNFLICLILSSLWWFFPPLYPPTKSLFIAHASIGLFNLLPCYPLDGGRVVLSLVKNKKRCLLVLRTVGFILGTACAALFIVGLFYRIIPQLIVLSAMFYIGAATEVKKEMYRVRFLDCYFVKDGGPTEEKTLYVPPEMKINKLLSSLSGRYVYIIVVTHGEKEIARLSGRAIEDLFLGDRDMSIGRYLSQNNLVGV